MSTVAISAGAAFLAATVSTLAALYVGRRNRGTSLRVAEFQKELAEVVQRRQLCLTLGSRALLVGERAAEVRSGAASFQQLSAAARQEETRRRMDRLDRACDGFVESWVEVAGWDLAPVRLGLLVDELSNALETARLLVVLDDVTQQSLALREVDRVARLINGLCFEMAKSLVMPMANPSGVP